MKKILFILPVLILLFSCFAQNKKKNTNSGLPVNTTFLNINPQPFITSLPRVLNETSGLIFYKGLLWTINDCGGKNVVYGFDFNGEIQHEIEIKDAKNNDWEEIAQDEKHIYIGDFGNNNGMRKDLKIYKIKKKDIGKKAKQKVDSKKIEFEYKNQNNYNFQHHVTPYDCEAMIAFNNNLLIFSKNWKTRTTEIYKMPVKKGKYNLLPTDSINVTGLITGADISPDKNKLALIGYKNFKPILWIFSDFDADSLFRGKRTFIEMDSIHSAQTEGICFLGNDSLLISCEANGYFNHQVFLLDLKTIDTNGAHPGK